MNSEELRRECEVELNNILDYWSATTIDEINGGFYGKINNDNIPDPTSVKGSVLYGRMLWSFSAAYRYSKKHEHLQLATRAFDFIVAHFLDNKYGGVYWTVNANGSAADQKKQIYACAFILYGMSEYHRAVKDEQSKGIAIDLFNAIVAHGYDAEYGGFYEAFSREWHELSDQRLSAKDANEKKSMNTNLHVLEAFTNLYLVWPDETVKHHITALLRIFSDRIIGSNGHLMLFFDEQWNNKPNVISYGHDIEASWLLLQSAEAINDQSMVSIFKKLAVKIADASMEGIDSDGGLWYEYDTVNNKLIKQKHWWPQAEALVGFYNAWQLSNNELYRRLCLNVWKFIRAHIIARNGEWYWGINEDGTVMNEDKAGLWKCPYHNSRACLEIINRSLA